MQTLRSLLEEFDPHKKRLPRVREMLEELWPRVISMELSQGTAAQFRSFLTEAFERHHNQPNTIVMLLVGVCGSLPTTAGKVRARTRGASMKKS